MSYWSASSPCVAGWGYRNIRWDFRPSTGGQLAFLHACSAQVPLVSFLFRSTGLLRVCQTFRSCNTEVVDVTDAGFSTVMSCWGRNYLLGGWGGGLVFVDSFYFYLYACILGGGAQL